LRESFIVEPLTIAIGWDLEHVLRLRPAHFVPTASSSSSPSTGQQRERAPMVSRSFATPRSSANVCGSARTREVRSLAARLELELAGLPRGFGQGDFWGGNLLSDSGRLVGVVDWAAAGSDSRS
jgi:aminoglycoside phosphotransferase (APT) family kinase protein